VRNEQRPSAPISDDDNADSSPTPSPRKYKLRSRKSRLPLSRKPLVS
jgi:hypothetical protein